MKDLEIWLLAAGTLGPLLYMVPKTNGGWLGLWHPRVREPFLTMLGATATYFLGSWLAGVGDEGQATGQWSGMGGVMVTFAIVIWFIAMHFLTTAIADRKQAATRIADDLDRLLDPTDSHFVVNEDSAHRPLELLEELRAVIGPAKHAPGHPWATHKWIAERIESARTVHPTTSTLRVES